MASFSPFRGQAGQADPTDPASSDSSALFDEFTDHEGWSSQESVPTTQSKGSGGLQLPVSFVPNI